MPSVNLKKMRFISFLWGAIMFSLVTALTAYGLYYKNQTKEYKSLESLMEAKVQEYIEQEGITVEDSLKITKDDLITKDFIEKLEVKNQSCDGFVIVTKSSNKFNYDAFIDCNKYKTKNYSKNI